MHYDTSVRANHSARNASKQSRPHFVRHPAPCHQRVLSVRPHRAKQERRDTRAITGNASLRLFGSAGSPLLKQTPMPLTQNLLGQSSLPTPLAFTEDARRTALAWIRLS
ncbi:hypothetical protein TRVL_09501 [Trypanosoma vivax]|nr:hypothetical protein TRVL_09501 [Trypanosoma vivax]